MWKKLLISLLVLVTLMGCNNQPSNSSDENEGSNTEAEIEPDLEPVDRNQSKIGDGLETDRLIRGSFFSQALDLRKNYYIYLPEEYHHNEKKNFPVLYLLRAHENEWISDGRKVLDVYEKLLSEEKIGPMILVFPNMTATAGNKTNGLGINHLIPIDVRGFGTGKYEDYFVYDLIGHIDSQYRTIDNRFGRAIDGFSLGGFTSLNIALKHPDKFCSVGAFDGSFLNYDNLVDPYHDSFIASFFNNAFGTPGERDREYASKNNPANLIKDGDFNKLKTLAYHIQTVPAAGNHSKNKMIISLLEEKGLTNSIETGVLEKSLHDWPSAVRHIEVTLPKHFKEFKQGGY